MLLPKGFQNPEDSRTKRVSEISGWIRKWKHSRAKSISECLLEFGILGCCEVTAALAGEMGDWSKI